MGNIRKTVLDEYNNTITLHHKSNYENIRRAGELDSKVLEYIAPMVIEGVTTQEWDDLCHKFIVEKKEIHTPLT